MKKNLLHSMLVAGMMACGISAQAQVYIETDMTSQFQSLTQNTSWTGSIGYTATNFCPAVTTNAGQTVQMVESYVQTCANTGDVMYATVTGLPAGTYKIELYGGAAFTFGRGFSSTAFTNDNGDTNAQYQAGDHIDTNTGVVLYAETSEGSYGGEIPIYYATNFPDGAAVVKMEGVTVGSDGKVKIGMRKTSTSTNWHIIQLKGVTAQVDAIELLKSEIASAQTVRNNYANADGVATLDNAIATAQGFLTSTSADDILAAIDNLKKAIKDFRDSLLFTFNETVYIIDAETGLFMAAGHNYGTRAIVNETGLDLIAAADENTKTMTFDTRVSNGGNNHFLGSNLYMDAAAYGWRMEYVGFGFYITNGSQYINLDNDNNLVMSATPREWVVVTAEGVTEERFGELDEATQANPADATFLLQNPNFNRNDQRVAAWVISDDCTNHNLNGGNQVNNCAESFHSPFTISQVVTDAPAGIYTMTAQGFYRQDGEAQEDAPIFFINDSNTPVPARTGQEGDMNAASESFTKGQYTIEPISTVLKSGETLTVGVKGTAVNQWVIFDNFRLTYYFDATIVGITDVNASAPQDCRYYNLNGQQVNSPAKGLYIMNGKKVVVK